MPVDNFKIFDNCDVSGKPDLTLRGWTRHVIEYGDWYKSTEPDYQLHLDPDYDYIMGNIRGQLDRWDNTLHRGVDCEHWYPNDAHTANTCIWRAVGWNDPHRDNNPELVHSQYSIFPKREWFKNIYSGAPDEHHQDRYKSWQNEVQDISPLVEYLDYLTPSTYIFYEGSTQAEIQLYVANMVEEALKYHPIVMPFFWTRYHSEPTTQNRWILEQEFRWMLDAAYNAGASGVIIWDAPINTTTDPYHPWDETKPFYSAIETFISDHSITTLADFSNILQTTVAAEDSITINVSNGDWSNVLTGQVATDMAEFSNVLFGTVITGAPSWSNVLFGEVTPGAELIAPSWDTPVDDRSDPINNMPLQEDFTGKYSGNPTPVVTIEPAVTGFSIEGETVEATEVAGEGAHLINLRATNSEGSADEPFTWTLAASSLSWDPIPATTPVHQSQLPATHSADYATSINGPIVYSLVSPPVGFTIDPVTGLITVAEGTVTQEAYLTVRATNDDTSSDAPPLLWSIRDDLFNETVTDVTETTCTASVDSATDSGTLYMAVRPSGAYPPYAKGDENAIKNAVGAEFSSSTTPPLIGTNTYSVIGLTSGTGYHVGFVIEP